MNRYLTAACLREQRELIAELPVPADNCCFAMGPAFVSASFWMSVDVFM